MRPRSPSPPRRGSAPSPPSRQAAALAAGACCGLLLLLLLPSSGASALEPQLALRLGPSLPPSGYPANAGLSLGAQAGLRLDHRWAIVLGADQTAHAMPGGSLRVLTASLGIEAALDLLPVEPFVGLAAGLQAAGPRGAGFDWAGLTGVLGGGARVHLVGPLFVGLSARYLTNGFAGTGLPAYTTVFFEAGVRPRRGDR